MRVVLITMNPNLGASARALQDWIYDARGCGVEMLIVVRQAGGLSRWLDCHGFDHQVNEMPWLDRRSCFRWIRSISKLRHWLKGRTPDLIHCYEDDLWPFAWPLKHIFRAPIICQFHFIPAPAYARWLFGRWIKRPDHVIWVSDSQRRDAANAVDDVLHCPESVVPLGVDLERFGTAVAAGKQLRALLQIAEHEVVVAGACALRPGKRIEEFINASVAILNRAPQTQIVLAGAPVAADGDYGVQIAARLRSMEKEWTSRFHWLGHVEPIEPVLQAADIVLSTSEYETFGMSNCEAMACGKPVVAYAAGAVPDVLGPAGITCMLGDVRQIADAVERLVWDRPLRCSLGQAARERVASHFNPRQSFRQLLNIYESTQRKRGVRQATAEAAA